MERVRYQFEKPEQELILELKDDESVLSERTGGKASSVKTARFDNSVRGTGITYEDLACDFSTGETPRSSTRKAFVAARPGRSKCNPYRDSSQYGVARLWVDKESGALHAH